MHVIGQDILTEESRARGRTRLAEARRKYPPEHYGTLRERFGPIIAIDQ